MNFMDTILTRRSVRDYKKQDVPDDLINNILNAAMSSPSAYNQQLWEFIILKEKSIIDEIPKIHPAAVPITRAPLAIIVCANLNREKKEGFWVQDCAAATQTILIAARGNGLGGVWLGIYPREERVIGLKRLLKLPEYVIPFSAVPIGYPLKEQCDEERFDENKIHYDKW